MNDLTNNGSRFVSDLAEAARKNPLSAGLIGIGVLWLFTGSRPMDRVAALARRTGIDGFPDATSETFDSARSGIRAGANSFGDGVKLATESLREGGRTAVGSTVRTGAEYADAASDIAKKLPDSGMAAFDAMHSNLTELFRAQPLVLGAVGLAIGAGIAAALPATEIEAAYMGDASDAVKGKAVDVASEQASRAATVVEKVVSAAGDEARKQGLTVEDAKSAVNDISRKVRRVVNAASS